MDKIKNSTWAYLAGIIDGEGTITITMQKQYKRSTVSLRPWISVSNTNFSLIDFLFDTFGGSKMKKGGKLKKFYKPSMVWRAMGANKILYIIDGCLPHLIIKKKQAELLSEYLISRKKQRTFNKRAAYSKRELLIQQTIKLLNKRGRQITS